MIEGVIFDCDGTLLDSMPAWHRLEAELARKAGISLSPFQLVCLNSNTLPETASFFHECGLGESAEEVLSFARGRLLREYRSHVQPREGAYELVSRLHDDGVKLAVASSSPSCFLEAGLQRAGMLELFDVIASAEDEGRSKGDPQFALSVAFRLGVSPENCWCVDDSVYALRAMSESGFMTLGIYDSDNAGTKEDLREVADSYIGEFDEMDYGCFVRSWKRAPLVSGLPFSLGAG